jgi:hypothetical protein
MFRTACAALTCALIAPAVASAADDGVVRVKSSYSVPETIERIKKDIAAKGIMYFSEIDQAALAAAAGVRLRPSAGATAGDAGRDGTGLGGLH